METTTETRQQRRLIKRGEARLPKSQHKRARVRKKVWSPLPGSQAYAMACPCNRILYHGTRGPGKTDAQIFAFVQHVGKGYGRHWRGVIFDREYKNLNDIISKCLRWIPQLGDGARFLSSGADLKWVWPTGEELLFRTVKRKTDYHGFHGHEYPFIGWNELTKHPNSELYDMMMSTNRTSFVPEEHSPDPENPLPDIPLVIFSTTNPHGVGHAWVKRRFKLGIVPDGEVQYERTMVFNPRTQKEELVVTTQVAIFGSYIENIYLPPEYIAGLRRTKDPNRRKAWLEGDWNITAGGAIDDLWDPLVHILPRFKVPDGWKVDRSMDWGSTHPFSVGYWAEANGEEALLPMPNGKTKTFCPPKGTLIRIAEVYGCPVDEIGENKGSRLSSPKVAKKVKKMDQELLINGWIEEEVRPGPADNQISNVNDDDTDTIEFKMAREGVRWTKSDKGKGSRKIGLQLLRDRLDAAITGEGPAIYFTRNCEAAILTLPGLPRDEDDEDDVDTESEDHAYDDTRYRLLAGNRRAATKINTKFPT